MSECHSLCLTRIGVCVFVFVCVCVCVWVPGCSTWHHIISHRHIIFDVEEGLILVLLRTQSLFDVGGI
jgi:hypothetical protein